MTHSGKLGKLRLNAAIILQIQEIKLTPFDLSKE
jgi:hypothetical protein